MQAFATALRAQKFMKPETMHIPTEHLLYGGTVMVWFNLNEVTTADLDDIQFNEVIVAQHNGQYQGICLWFNATFPIGGDGDTITLSTAPTSDSTH